jgi:hypothetical protein
MICAGCLDLGLLATGTTDVCLRGGDRFADCIIEASAEHLTDRIRNADSGRTGGHGDVDDHKEADRMTSEGARSEAVAYLKGRSGA